MKIRILRFLLMFFIMLMGSYATSGIMGNGKVFLSNTDFSALYCVMKKFPDGENVGEYQAGLIYDVHNVDVFVFESSISHDSDAMGGGGISYDYEYNIKNKTCYLKKKSKMK